MKWSVNQFRWWFLALATHENVMQYAVGIVYGWWWRQENLIIFRRKLRLDYTRFRTYLNLKFISFVRGTLSACFSLHHSYIIFFALIRFLLSILPIVDVVPLASGVVILFKILIYMCVTNFKYQYVTDDKATGRIAMIIIVVNRSHNRICLWWCVLRRALSTIIIIIIFNVDAIRAHIQFSWFFRV